MRSLWTLLLIALASLASGATAQASACDLQVASGRACGLNVLARAGVQIEISSAVTCGSVAAVPVADGASDDPDGSDQGPERVDSDAGIVNTISLGVHSSSVLRMRVESELEPESRSQDWTQQPPRA